MQVKFTRTGTRRYAVEANRADYETVVMDPAPGYDDLLPHDLVHFVVEQELGLMLGVFGQLARGGDAGTFRLAGESQGSRELSRARRRRKRRGQRLAREGRQDADLSERAAAICHHEWLSRAAVDPRRQGVARSPSAPSQRENSKAAEGAMLSKEAMQRIGERLECLSAQWAKLGVGQSLVLAWDPVRAAVAESADLAAIFPEGALNRPCRSS
jgi:hypothetical protein